MSATLWTAMLMSASDTNDPTRTGFTSEDAAWAYVLTRNCRYCREDLETGEEEHIAMTACSAEWDVRVADPEDNNYPGPPPPAAEEAK